jgi:hypothetical protein
VGLNLILTGYMVYKYISCIILLFGEIYNYHTYNNILVSELNFELIDPKLTNIYDYLSRPVNERVPGLAEFNQE